MDYRTKLMNAKRAYYKKVGEATAEDMLRAEAEGRSVAESEVDAFVALDFSTSYNLGDKPEDMNEEAGKNYRAFIKAFNLPEPTGKPPKKKFRLPID